MNFPGTRGVLKGNKPPGVCSTVRESVLAGSLKTSVFRGRLQTKLPPTSYPSPFSIEWIMKSCFIRIRIKQISKYLKSAMLEWCVSCFATAPSWLWLENQSSYNTFSHFKKDNKTETDIRQKVWADFLSDIMFSNQHFYCGTKPSRTFFLNLDIFTWVQHFTEYHLEHEASKKHQLRKLQQQQQLPWTKCRAMSCKHNLIINKYTCVHKIS